MSQKTLTTVLFGSFILVYSLFVSAKENINSPSVHHVKNNQNSKLAAPCAPPKQTLDLDTNNVKSKVFNGADMWWDIFGSGNAAYEVPKGGGVSSLFAGSIWIGGMASGALKVAGQTYRQNGHDFWPGPLDANGNVDDKTCKEFDRFWTTGSVDLDAFTEDWKDGKLDNPVPTSIKEYPAKGNPNVSFIGNRDLAEFKDVDADGIYNPEKGDYPMLGVSYEKANPNEIIWWVFNDKGDVHTESGGAPLGVEIHAQSFAFKTSDEVNDMTFLRYFIINKATTSLSQTYMGFWTDADLGDAGDDYVGCDTSLEMGICYNGDAVDGPGNPVNYGDLPPLVGIDYFQGPMGDNGKLLGMTSFMYFNNDGTATGNPGNASDYYNYMQATWRDGVKVTRGGNGYDPASTDFVDFMFYSDPKENAAPGVWSECSEGNAPYDRRFVQASGPFTLKPGAANEIIIGVPWVRPLKGTYPCPNFDKLRKADRKAQKLFDNKFELLKGPPPPEVKIVELDQQLILTITNYEATEGYKKVDQSLKKANIPDSFFVFQGYQIYQVSPDGNTTKLLAAIDVKDNVLGEIINWETDDLTRAYVATVMVTAQNNNIKHSFNITEDLFAQTSVRRIVNFKTYTFKIVPYAYNQFQRFDPDNPLLIAQDKPYLAGEAVTISGIPHKSLGKVMTAYDDEFEISRVEGRGNGGRELDLTAQSVADILANGSVGNGLKYQKGMGPVSVKVYDPLLIPNADFELYIQDSIPDSKVDADKKTYWYLVNKNTRDTTFAEKTINNYNEQLTMWGLSVAITQTKNTGADATVRRNGNGYISSSIEYVNAANKWLNGVRDDDVFANAFGVSQGNLFYEWILSGEVATDYGDSNGPLDSLQFFENLINGTWAPYRLCRRDAIGTGGPAWDNKAHQDAMKLDSLPSVDIVLTSDKSKWSRCVVIEVGDIDRLGNEGTQLTHQLRKHSSLNQDGTYDANEKGRSWFPGYAINLETGDRLNIMFGEDSNTDGLTDTSQAQTQRDMIWNPSSAVTKVIGTNSFSFPGGMHYIYILKSKYDECNTVFSALSSPSIDNPSVANMTSVYKEVAWVSMAFLAEGAKLNSLSQGIIPNDVTIKLRVARSYAAYTTNGENLAMPKYSFSTNGFAPDFGTEAQKDALDLIKVVPNPYYGYTSYESSAADKKVRIINLPAKCSITVYTLGGSLITKINRDNSAVTFEDWNLTNFAGVPVSSGVYLIHISAEGLGERTLKWFGVLRPADLANF